jgi:hypothetical protein
MLWLNAAGLALDAQLAVITLVTVGAIVGIIASRIRSKGEPAASPVSASPIIQGNPRNWLRWIRLGCIIIIAFELAYVALFAVGRPLTLWDSWVTYAMKARIIFLEDHIVDGVFADPSRTVTHLDYPLLVPLLEAWTFKWAGSADDRLAGIQSVFFFAALLILFYSVLRRLGIGEIPALIGTTILATVPNVSGQAVAVFADLPLAAYLTMASAYLILWLRSKSAGDLVIAALAAGLMPWTKREGIMLLSVLCLALLILNFRTRRIWIAPAALVGAAIILSGPWWVFVASHGVHNAAFIAITPSNFITNLPRLPHIVRWELPALLNADWSFIFPLGAFVALYTLRVRRQAIDLLPVVTFAYLTMMSFGYIFSDFVPYQQHVVSSIDRLLLHVLPLLLLWLAARAAA